MRVRELRGEDGQRTGIEIGNAVLGHVMTRHGVLRTIKRIPGVTVSFPRPWRLEQRRDDFVHFTLNGHKFLAIEPYGDSDVYWIVAEDAVDLPEIETVKRAFSKRWVAGI
jgi:hypothetical protein